MARIPRISPTDIHVHVIPRGNNRKPCLASDEELEEIRTNTHKGMAVGYGERDTSQPSQKINYNFPPRPAMLDAQQLAVRR